MRSIVCVPTRELVTQFCRHIMRTRECDDNRKAGRQEGHEKAKKGNARQFGIKFWRKMCIRTDWQHTRQKAVCRDNDQCNMAWVIRRSGIIMFADCKQNYNTDFLLFSSIILCCLFSNPSVTSNTLCFNQLLPMICHIF